MNLKKINKIERSISRLFSVDDDYLALIQDNHDFLLCSLSGDIITQYTSEDKISSVYVFSGITFVTFSNQQSLICHNERCQPFPFKLQAPIYSSNDGAVYITEKNEEYVKKINLKSETVIWQCNQDWHAGGHFETESHFFYLVDNAIFSQKPSKVKALDNKTGKELWQFNLPESYNYNDPFGANKAAKVEKTLGVYNGILWLILNSGTLLGLNTSDGTIARHTKKPSHLADNFTLDTSLYDAECGWGRLGINSFLDEDQGVVFTLSGDIYSEINLKQDDLPYTIWDVTSTLKEQPSLDENQHLIAARIAAWEKKTIYFYDTSSSQGFGAFDRKTRKIIWADVFEDKGEYPGILEMKVSNEYIYILSKSDKSLHIYKMDI